MGGDRRDVDKNPVAGIEVELWGTFDHQSGHTRWKDHPGLYLRRSTSKVDFHRSQGLVKDPHGERADDPAPRFRCVEDDERKVGPVEQVAEVEDLKETSAADEGKGTDKDDCHDCHQGNSGGIGEPRNEAKQVRF